MTALIDARIVGSPAVKHRVTCQWNFCLLFCFGVVGYILCHFLNFFFGQPYVIFLIFHEFLIYCTKIVIFSNLALSRRNVIA